MDMSGNELRERVRHCDDRLAEVGVGHAGGAPQPPCPRHVTPVGRSPGTILRHKGSSFFLREIYSAACRWAAGRSCAMLLSARRHGPPGRLACEGFRPMRSSRSQSGPRSMPVNHPYTLRQDRGSGAAKPQKCAQTFDRNWRPTKGSGPRIRTAGRRGSSSPPHEICLSCPSDRCRLPCAPHASEQDHAGLFRTAPRQQVTRISPRFAINQPGQALSNWQCSKTSLPYRESLATRAWRFRRDQDSVGSAWSC
jgi:hypothetical protein